MKLRWHDEREPRALADEGIEVWAPIPDAVRYAVSNLGRVASSAQGSWKFMTLSTVGAGYRSVGFRDDAGSRNGSRLVHRLAALAFDGPPPTPVHTDVRHLDGDKGNNALSNLLWGTRSENMLDVLRHRQEQGGAVAAAGIEEAKAAGTWYGGRTWDTELVEKVVALEREGYLTVVQAADLLGVSTQVVSNIVRGNSHAHVSTSAKKKQKRRNKRQKDLILARLRDGVTLDELNERPDEIGGPLTHQAVYYYKQKLKEG